MDAEGIDLPMRLSTVNRALSQKVIAAGTTATHQMDQQEQWKRNKYLLVQSPC